MSKPVIIKKYANRRLYDTNKSSYVTLEDLAELVREGVDFVVKDAKSEEDLTRTTLTQIIFELESKGYNLLPDSFLRQLIAFYGGGFNKVLPSYLDETMNNFVANQDKIKDAMGVSGDFSPLKQFEEMGKKNMEMFEQTMSMFNPFASGDKDK